MLVVPWYQLDFPDPFLILISYYYMIPYLCVHTWDPKLLCLAQLLLVSVWDPQVFGLHAPTFCMDLNVSIIFLSWWCWVGSLNLECMPRLLQGMIHTKIFCRAYLSGGVYHSWFYLKGNSKYGVGNHCIRNIKLESTILPLNFSWKEVHYAGVYRGVSLLSVRPSDGEVVIVVHPKL